MSVQKAKGTAAETAILRFLQEKGLLVLRNPPSGSKDKGDLTICGDTNFTVEVKNVKRMELSAWVDEALTEQANADTDFAVVMHKRVRKGHPSEWYCTMTIGQFAEMVKLLS